MLRGGGGAGLERSCRARRSDWLRTRELSDGVQVLEAWFAGHGFAHERATTVRFFLAVDHYRIARNVTDPVRAREHTRQARQALQHTVERSTQAFEVRAAQTLLETLPR